MYTSTASGWRAPRAPRTYRLTTDHAIQRPPSRRSGQHQPQSFSRDYSSQPPMLNLRQEYEWSKFPELTVRLRNLSSGTTTYDLYRNFKRHGKIVMIEIFEGRSGSRDGCGKIRFSPPPQEAFWAQPGALNRYEMRSENGHERYICTVELDERTKKRLFKIRSPINKSVEYDEKMKLIPSSLHFGVMLGPESLMTMESINVIPGDELSLVVDLLRSRLVATFMVDFKDPRSQGNTHYISTSEISAYERKNKYMFQIPFSELHKIYRVGLSDSMIALVMTLESPPAFYRKREDEKSCHSKDNLLWTEFDTWYRQTDIVYDPYRLTNATVALHKERPVIDIGRWTTYKFVFNTKQNDASTYLKIKQALQDFNIEIVPLDRLIDVPARPAELWSLIDPSPSLHAAADLQDLEGGGVVMLPFEVRYQLEVCISREILNEHNLTKAFVEILSDIATKDSAKAQHILEYIAEQDKRVYNPMSIFEDKEALAYSSKSDIPHYCAYSRKATITPTTIYFNSPTVETTNRVLRHYSRENKDGRFLRVQFTDEMAEGRINSCADKQRNDELFTRVYRTLFNGIRIGDRHYEFLAFGNSQFRENGAYFFCPTEHLSCDDIRQWMGNFSHIKVVAKYAARLGQCFSTTRAIHGLSKPDIVKIPDIERNGYCFTDGVGKISSFLAQMITAELGLRFKTAPSAFQFRLGGCKGILVVSPDAKDKEVHIRKSQQKFIATYNGLEIIRWSRFSCATLNRQTITILSALGVPDEVFLKMLTEQLSNYQTAMSDHAVAQSLLSKYVDDNHMTINIATMIHNGFMVQREPFVISLLHLWRAWSIKLLKEKAKIIVENGAFLLGCVDETASLRGFSNPTIAPGESFTEGELPQIFVQVPSKTDANCYNVIEGICLVGRNPSLHPGDLRVVQAINVPALHHLRDVVVFPQTGDRDVPGMCSGGDLDGDDFFVIWEKELQPPEWNCEPMNFAAPTPKTQTQPVKVTDLMKFFVRFMKNDSLPTIAHAHLAQSDYLDDSVKDPKCLELAALHSKAVDYVKTGQPAEMPKRLKPHRWPHFMEKRYKPKDATYHSEKILGQLYDKVESVDFVPQYEEPFDRRILRAYNLEDALLKTCRQIKSKYDTAMRRIMAQQEIKTEFEVWSTFVLSRPRVGSDYKVQEEMARYSDDLKNRFRMICIEQAGSKDFSVLGPFVAGMYRVTKEELDIALAECHSTKVVGGREVPKRRMEPKYMPLISFPWLFEKELARIATGIERSDDLDALGLQPLVLKGDSGRQRKHGAGGDLDLDDFIRQEDGVIVHRGEVLDLFRPDFDSDDLFGECDFEEARAEHSSMFINNSAEDLLATSIDYRSSPDHFLSGTGVEDVVTRVKLDGLSGPRENARLVHPSSVKSAPFIQGSVSQTSSSDNEASMPAAELLEITGRSVSTPSSDPTSQNRGLVESSSSEQERELEEEVVELDVEKSALEKLAEMIAP